MSFEDEIRRLAKYNPQMLLSTAIFMVDNPVGVAPPTVGGAMAPVEAVAAWAYETPVIMTLLLSDKKINAIKEVRVQTGVGLKEAKEAVELCQLWESQGRPHRSELEGLEEEVEEAIASITAVKTAAQKEL